MKKLAVLLLFLVFLASAGPAAAQGEGPTLETVVVQLWPEYDDPRLLVLIDALFTSDVSFPQEVTFSVPKGAQINQMAWVTADGRVERGPYSTLREGAWERVTYTPKTGQLFYEYYTDAIVRDGTRRTVTFRFRVDYPTQALEIRIQEPAGARNVQIDPEPKGSILRPEDGLRYYLLSFSALKPGDEMAITMTYEKEGDALTVDQVGRAPESGLGGGGSPPPSQGEEGALIGTLPSAGSTPSSPPPSARSDRSLLWVILFTALGSALVGAGLVWIWVSGRTQTKEKRSPARLRRERRRPIAVRTKTAEVKKKEKGSPSSPLLALAILGGLLLVGGGVLAALEAGQSAPPPTLPVSSNPAPADAGVGAAIPRPPVDALGPVDQERMARGAQLYAQFCSECHGAAAEGGTGPALNAQGDAYLLSDNELRAILAHGQGDMPGFADRLSLEQIDDLIYFVKRQWTEAQRQQQAGLNR